MAVSASKQPPNVASALHIVPTGTGSGNGLVNRPTLPSLPLPPPPAIPQTSYAVGSDTVSFTVKPRQTITVTFPNLPTRTPSANPLFLRQSATDVQVRPGDTLHFGVALQNVTGTTPTVSPVTVDQSRARAPGSFLGGGNKYGTFQAVITGGAAGASGTVVGTLTYMVGG